jgi:hypothetical protein
MLRLLVNAAAWMLSAVIVPAVAAPGPGSAIVVGDPVALRAEPRASARPQAQLWQGEVVEVRGERMDYLQVYDYRRERGGYVHASQVRRAGLSAEEAPGLLAVVRFVRDTPGLEALGIGFAAAYVQAAPAEVLRETGAEVLDALGSLADRLAERASSGGRRSKSAEAALAAHLDVAARYGIRFASHERNGRMQICYEGDAYRRVLSMRASPEQRARAALGLTRPECVNPDLGLRERHRMYEEKADVLERVDASALPAWLRNRVLMRRASVWSSLAYQRARRGEAADAAASRALSEFASVQKGELADGDLSAYNDAAMRVSASRWAASPAAAVTAARRAHIVVTPGAPGESCIALIDPKAEGSEPMAKRCTYGLVWAGSARLNREGNALTVAVQPMEAWREIWLFRRQGDAWSVRVLPPAAVAPGIGYAEFAGWVPGGRHMLVAREARGDGKYRRHFEVVRLDTLAVAGESADPGTLGAFRRWRDSSWHQATLSVR